MFCFFYGEKWGYTIVYKRRLIVEGCWMPLDWMGTPKWSFERGKDDQSKRDTLSNKTLYLYIHVLFLVVWDITFIFPNSWDDDSIWLIFFRGIETTNQCVCIVSQTCFLGCIPPRKNALKVQRIVWISYSTWWFSAARHGEVLLSTVHEFLAGSSNLNLAAPAHHHPGMADPVDSCAQNVSSKMVKCSNEIGIYLVWGKS